MLMLMLAVIIVLGIDKLHFEAKHLSRKEKLAQTKKAFSDFHVSTAKALGELREAQR